MSDQKDTIDSRKVINNYNRFVEVLKRQPGSVHLHDKMAYLHETKNGREYLDPYALGTSRAEILLQDIESKLGIKNKYGYSGDVDREEDKWPKYSY